MTSVAHRERIATPTGLRGVDRLAAGFLLVLMAVGSLVLWIGVPAGCLWLVSQLTETGSTHFVLGVITVPLGMVLFFPVLVWLNRLYLRVVLQPAEPGGDEEEDDETERHYARGPLEPMLAVSFALALIALTVWFFFYAENPPRHFF